MTDFPPATDQASGLRRLFEKRTESAIIAVLPTLPRGSRLGDSGRVVMQIADDFLAGGRSLSVIDEHPAPGSLSHAYGITGHKDLKHALRGDYPLEDVVFSPRPGLAVVPASRAAAMEFTLGDDASLNGNLVLLKTRSACVMIDCAPRTARALSPIAACADRFFVVVPGRTEDITRAYGVIKRIAAERILPDVSIVVVRAADPQQARSVYETLRRVAHDHLGIGLRYQGAVLTPGAPRMSLAPPPAVSSQGGANRHGEGFWRDEEIADSMV